MAKIGDADGNTENMPMTYQVDDIDRMIIACLQKSARKSNTLIAAELGLSESTVRRRLDRLLAGDFVRILAVADPLKIGYPVVAIIGLQCAPSSLAEVESLLADLDEFRFIGMTTGAYDFIAEAWFKSLDELRIFITERLSGVKGVQRIETTHVLKMVRYLYDWGRVNQPLAREQAAAGTQP
jgi:Lrp/AsnC family transcriptional regulator, regulator for asnA, asnC and gidA